MSDTPKVTACNLPTMGRCCCSCRYHIKDFHHCATINRADFADSDCVCSTQKGWICAPAEMERAWSGWSEHGLCELHDKVTP